ncbi:MAG: AmmeMemoRadiSam system radical SAM enzyme [candidate division WOR-3 bacterium]|nr:MAG: AmmeMemoRadiSam system radical SAM enzyme [candidate division WOR-3 bacterium]
MELFFEKLISRRNFLKKCGWLAMSGVVVSKLSQFAHAQEAKLGYVDAKKALYYKRLSNRRVQCTLCPRACIVSDGERGFCRVRENRGGEYYTLVHSNPCAVHIDPIEKKPLFHFRPGTAALSIATAGCNFTCKNCQNYDISQARPDDTVNIRLSPGDVVDLALKYETPTIAYTYTEPTVFYEYMLETSKIAHRKGVLNIYHSNGYISQEALAVLAQHLDGANVDLKGFSDSFYREVTGGTLKPVLESLKILKKCGVWVEITNLVIPTKNDSDNMIEELCQWVKSELGRETPVHFSRFYPQYKMQNLPPTPVETLKKAAEIAYSSGLDYVYIGNVPGIAEENTNCPKCGKVLVGRTGYHVHSYELDSGCCRYCRTEIAGRWK